MNLEELKRPRYNRALKALQAAHDACFKHPDRDVLGMSHGPFSGVNEALGIIAELEDALPAAYAAGRADQRKDDVEIARGLYAPAREEAAKSEDEVRSAWWYGRATAAESIAKAIEEQKG